MAKGRKTGGGSRKGSPNKVTAALVAKQQASGLMPLEFMLDLMRTEPLPPALPENPNPQDVVEYAKKFAATHEMRFEAAKAAAPYLHPRLASTEVKLPQKIVHEVRVTIAKPK